MDTKSDILTSSELGAKATQKWTKPDKLSACNALFEIVRTRYHKVADKYPDHPSLQHSAYVLQEEFNEVMQEMKAKDGMWDYLRLYDELVDLIVAAYRMVSEHPDLAAQNAAIPGTYYYNNTEFLPRGE